MTSDRSFNVDDSLKKLARNYDDEWESCEFKEDLLKAMNNHLDIAIVIYGTLLDDSMSWVSRSVPALSGLTPIQCMSTPSGIKRLKQILLSLPR